MRQNKSCTLCQLHKDCFNRCIWGTGNPNAKMMLVGEAPGGIEDRQGKPFVGQAGELLNHILNKLSIDREKIYITNVFKCRPPQNKLPKKSELDDCWIHCNGYLWQEVRDVCPKIIVLMGNTPLKFMAEKSFISKWEGGIVGAIGKIDFIASYHPAAALHAPRIEKNIATALYVAAKKAGLKPKPKGIEAGMFDYNVLR